MKVRNDWEALKKALNSKKVVWISYDEKDPARKFFLLDGKYFEFESHQEATKQWEFALSLNAYLVWHYALGEKWMETAKGEGWTEDESKIALALLEGRTTPGIREEEVASFKFFMGQNTGRKRTALLYIPHCAGTDLCSYLQVEKIIKMAKKIGMNMEDQRTSLNSMVKNYLNSD